MARERHVNLSRALIQAGLFFLISHNGASGMYQSVITTLLYKISIDVIFNALSKCHLYA